MDNALLFSNALGAVTMPIAYYQFASREKGDFLLLNMVSCLIWWAALFLSGEPATASVSLVAAAASLAQKQLATARAWQRSAIAVLFMGMDAAITLPRTPWAWIAVAAFLWFRLAESLPNLVMRWMLPLSPAIWIGIAFHAGAYTLIPGDLVAFYTAIFWLVRHYQFVLKQNEA